MQKKIILLAIFILLSSLLSAFEINGDGTPADYTKIAINARYWGMGKTGAGFANDSGGIMLNPAGIGTLKSLEFSGMSTKLLGEFNYSVLNVVYPLEHETIGCTMLYETAGEILATDGLDAYGHPVKGEEIENYNQSFTFGYGRKFLLDNLYLGAAIRYLHKRIYFIDANSTACDLGALYKLNSNVAFGFVAKNALQTELKYSNGASYGEHIEPDYILGASWLLLNKDLILAIDQHTNQNFGRTQLGAEYWWADMVALRTGLAERDITFGVGFRYDMFQIDYAVQYKEAPLESQSFVSITWGDARRASLAQPMIELAEEAANSPDPTPVAPVNLNKNTAQAAPTLKIVNENKPSLNNTVETDKAVPISYY